MSRVPMTQAVAADYADAMLVARKAKNTLFYLLFLVVAAQLAMFLVSRYVAGAGLNEQGMPSPAVHESVEKLPRTIVEPTTLPATLPTTIATSVESRPAMPGGIARIWPSVVGYLTPVTVFLGFTLTLVLALVLFVIIMIMLVGRLVGVSHVMGGFCWAIFLLVIIFPWQTLLGTAPPSSPAGADSCETCDQQSDIRIPGVLYTYSELKAGYNFDATDWRMTWMKWARFTVGPGAALLILLMIQGRSSRGLKYALGEKELPAHA